MIPMRERRSTRRDFLAGAAGAAASRGAAQQASEPNPGAAPRIYLDQFQPKSMLALEEHHPKPARFPLIDVHTHVSHLFGAKIFGAPGQSSAAPADPRAAALRVSPGLYGPYFRFLETLDEYFDYPAPGINQGRWMISGIGLPEDILKKVYHDNAARLLS
jgi:hypothetical protein